MAEDKGKSLKDYAEKMGVTLEELKRGMDKYGVKESDLQAYQKRQVLADAIENKWSRDQYRGAYDAAVPESSDFSWETIVTKYGYSLGVIREYKDDLKPIFKWLAGQLQKGESLQNLQAEFERRVNDTKFGNRPSSELNADLARYGTKRKDFRKSLEALSKRIKKVGQQKFGDSILDNLDDGVAWQLALDLMYQEDGFLGGSYDSFNEEAIVRRLQTYQQQNLAEPVPGEGVEAGTPGSMDLGGEAGSLRNQLQVWLSRNGITRDNSGMVDGYVTKLQDGTMTMEAVKQEIRNTTFTRLYSGYADLFSKGQDIADIAMDFRQRASDLLETGLDSVGIDHHLVQGAMNNRTKEGALTPMTMYEFEQSVRKDPEWDKTNNAMKAYTDVGETILRNFGFRG